MNRTKIEWIKNPDGTQGYTSNPVRGECPIGCSYCFVKPFRNRYGWHKDIRFYPQELEAIRKRRKPCGIFLGSTIELFHDKTIIYMPEIMETIKAYPQHRFYLLTKQPQNLPKFSPFPENCWVGVTATNWRMYEAALEAFCQIKAHIAYLSFEPLLEQITIEESSVKPLINDFNMTLKKTNKRLIDWLIIGAQTKPYKPPKIEWVQEIVEAADKAGIPVFLKENLKSLLPEEEPFYTVIDEDPMQTPRLRQELPK